MGSLRPSARTPIITSRHSLCSSSRMFTWIPSAHRYTLSTPDRSRAAKARCSACHVSVSRMITGPDSPAAEPRNWPSAGTKSPLDRPCRYSSGSTSVTFGVLRAHGGKIAEENRFRSPVSGSARLSFELPSWRWLLGRAGRCPGLPLS